MLPRAYYRLCICSHATLRHPTDIYVMGSPCIDCDCQNFEWSNEYVSSRDLAKLYPQENKLKPQYIEHNGTLIGSGIDSYVVDVRTDFNCGMIFGVCKIHDHNKLVPVIYGFTIRYTSIPEALQLAAAKTQEMMKENYHITQLTFSP